MLKKTLKLEQLERKDLFAGLAEVVADEVGQPVADEVTSSEMSGHRVDNQVVIEVDPARITVETAKPGDVNLDGEFNQLDLVHLLQQDKYMKDEPAKWGQGDFNGDGFFSQLDLVEALQEGRYAGQSAAAISGGGPIAGDGQTSITYDPTVGVVA